MKKIILTFLIIGAAFTVKAQSVDPAQPQKDKTEYSFFWGLFKSKEYPRDKTVVLEIEKPDFSTSISIDTTKYEEKSLLWGAIKWTEKKEN